MGKTEDAIATWREQTHEYVRAINELVVRGRRDGWAAAGPEPVDPRSPELAAEILRRVREANADGRWRELRKAIPPAHAPLVQTFERRARFVRNVFWLDDDRVVATVGATHDGPEVHVVDHRGETTWMPPFVAAGRSPDGALVAFASAYDVEVRPRAEALEGRRSSVAFALPEATATDGPFAEQLLVVPDGSGVVVVRADGVFVCDAAGSRRLFPEAAPDARLPMVHAALSPDGRFLAMGSQDSQHLLVELASGEVLARFGPIHSSYPHHAAFSPEGAFVFFNSCHFYNGVSVAAPVDALFGLELPRYEDDPRLVVLDAECRVYASTFRDGRFVLGDAYGYLRERGVDGSEGWQHFCGSSIGGVAFSPDGRRLAVGTAAGGLHFLDVDAPIPPFQIGNAPFAEQLRLYFWRDELLRW